MQFLVQVTTAELAEMKMSSEQLKESVMQTLDEHAVDQNGERFEYAEFFVDVEVMPTKEEFAKGIR